MSTNYIHITKLDGSKFDRSVIKFYEPRNYAAKNAGLPIDPNLKLDGPYIGVIERKITVDKNRAMVLYRNPIDFEKLAAEGRLNAINSIGYSPIFFPETPSPKDLKNLETIDHISSVISEVIDRRNWKEIKAESEERRQLKIKHEDQKRYGRFDPKKAREDLRTDRFLLRLFVHVAPYIPIGIGSVIAMAIAIMVGLITLFPVYLFVSILCA